MISMDIGTVDTSSAWLIKNLDMELKGWMKRSTHRPHRLVLLRKILSGKSFNWLFSNSLPTKNHNQCQLYDKTEFTENKNNKK